MEYMEVLNQIIEAERTAQRIASEAKRQRDTLPNDLRANWNETHAEHLARAGRRVQVIHDQEDAMAAQQIEQLDAELREELRKLETYFDSHREEMMEKLFRLVTDT